MKTEKAIIIGGGPTGLSAAIYNSRAGLAPLVIAGSPPGGQLTLTSKVENYPGYYSILGPVLIEKIRAQAKKFGTRFVDENVSSVDFSKKPFTVFTNNNKTSYQAKAVLIASGAEPKWLGLESEKRLWGKGISTCAICDGFFFKDKIVAVVGGGDTAMEEALTLTKFAKKVYLIHRRDKFRSSKIMQERVFKNKKIEIIWNAEVVAVLGKEKVEGIKLKIKNKRSKIKNTNQRPKNLKILKIDGLFIAIGRRPATDFLKDSGVLVDERGYVKISAVKALDTAKWLNGYIAKNNKFTSEKYNQAKGAQFDFSFQYQTSVPGVFAAGDVVDYLYQQAGTAVGAGIAAALEVERYLELLED